MHFCGDYVDETSIDVFSDYNDASKIIVPKYNIIGVDLLVSVDMQLTNLR